MIDILNPIFTDEDKAREHLADKGRKRGTVENHGEPPPVERRGAEICAPSPVHCSKSLGEQIMRSNSGRDKSRNNMRDPTIRDRTEQRTKASHRSHRSPAKAPADHRHSHKD